MYCAVWVPTVGAMLTDPEAMVMLAALVSIEFYEDMPLPPQVNWKFTVIKTAPDGLCFWTCMWLSTEAHTDEVIAWFTRPRSEQGFAVGKADSSRESKVVFKWATGLQGMPTSCRQRLENRESADDPDLVA